MLRDLAPRARRSGSARTGRYAISSRAVSSPRQGPAQGAYTGQNQRRMLGAMHQSLHRTTGWAGSRCRTLGVLAALVLCCSVEAQTSLEPAPILSWVHALKSTLPESGSNAYVQPSLPKAQPFLPPLTQLLSRTPHQ